MEVMTRKVFNIPEFCEEQVFSGSHNTAQTYSFSVKDDPETDPHTVIGTLYDVLTITDEETGAIKDIKLQLYPIWNENGPEDLLREILVSEILAAAQVYVKFSALYKAPRQTLSDDTPTFVFRFVNNDLIITPSNFVKVAYREENANLKKGEDNRRAVFGYITDVKNDMCKMITLSTYRGLFDLVETEIPLKSVYSVFRYFCEFSPFVHREETKEEASEPETEVDTAAE